MWSVGRGAALACLLIASADAAEAERWAIDAAASRIAIVYQINGEPWRGRFSRFEGGGAFDTNAPEAADLEIVIDTDSIDVGDMFGTAIAKTVDWLDVAGHPRSRYVLKSLTPLGGDRYRATGDLNLRGVTHEVAGEISLTIDETRTEATGAVTFDRGLFGIGVGFTALFVTIGDPIVVKFDLVTRSVE